MIPPITTTFGTFFGITKEWELSYWLRKSINFNELVNSQLTSKINIGLVDAVSTSSSLDN